MEAKSEKPSIARMAEVDRVCTLGFLCCVLLYPRALKYTLNSVAG